MGSGERNFYVFVDLFNFLDQQERQKAEESLSELSFLSSVFYPVPIEAVSPLVVSAESRQVLSSADLQASVRIDRLH